MNVLYSIFKVGRKFLTMSGLTSGPGFSELWLEGGCLQLTWGGGGGYHLFFVRELKIELFFRRTPDFHIQTDSGGGGGGVV